MDEANNLLLCLLIVIVGVVDSSGMTFYYIDTPRENNAGILQVGHQVNQFMIIPPKARNYTIYSFCSSTCTEVLSIELIMQYDSNIF